MKECFNNFDSNGDGYISMMEFVEVKTAFERKNEEKIPLGKYQEVPPQKVILGGPS